MYGESVVGSTNIRCLNNFAEGRVVKAGIDCAGRLPNSGNRVIGQPMKQVLDARSGVRRPLDAEYCRSHREVDVGLSHGTSGVVMSLGVLNEPDQFGLVAGAIALDEQRALAVLVVPVLLTALHDVVRLLRRATQLVLAVVN